MNPGIVELTNITTGFKGGLLFRGLSLSVSKGELVVIEGATGSGKTTLVRVLLGAQPIQAGMGKVLGTSLSRASASDITTLRRKIGVVFQHPLFLAQDSTLTNVTVPLAITGVTGETARAAVAPA